MGGLGDKALAQVRLDSCVTLGESKGSHQFCRRCADTRGVRRARAGQPRGARLGETADRPCDPDDRQGDSGER
jgi:hypothetical protein